MQLGLADAADRSLDLQYYAWHDDSAGWLLFQALHEAAGRRVRVRLLLDDSHTADLDRIEAGLKPLEQIGAASLLEVRRNLAEDQLGNAVELVVYGEFPDRAALAAYKADPRYAEAIRIVRPLRELRVAADIETER